MPTEINIPEALWKLFGNGDETIFQQVLDDIAVGKNIRTIGSGASTPPTPRRVHLSSVANTAGASDAGPALRQLNADLAAAGGLATVVLDGTFRIDGDIDWPASVAPQGRGHVASRVHMYNGGRFRFSDQTVDERFPRMGGFTIQGMDGSIDTAVEFGVSAAARIYDIQVIGTVGTAFKTLGLQNSLLSGLDTAAGTVQRGLVVDLGTLNCDFVSCHFGGSAGFNTVLVQQSGTTSPIVGSTILQPEKIRFWGGIFEGNSEVCFLVTAGKMIQLFGCTMNGATSAGSALRMVPSGSLQCSVMVSGGQLRSPGGIGADIQGQSTLTLTNNATFIATDKSVRHDDTAFIQDDGTINYRAGTPPYVSTTGSRPAGSQIQSAGRRVVPVTTPDVFTSNTLFTTLGGGGFFVVLRGEEVMDLDVDLWVTGVSPASGGGGIKYRCYSPDGVTVNWQALIPDPASSAGEYAPVNVKNFTEADWRDGLLLGTSVPIRHSFKITAKAPTAGGVLYFQARQTSSNATSTTVQGGQMVITKRPVI